MTKITRKTFELLRALLDNIRPCSSCCGTGDKFIHTKPGHEEACSQCGGQGQTLNATALISDIYEIKDLIWKGESE